MLGFLEEDLKRDYQRFLQESIGVDEIAAVGRIATPRRLNGGPASVPCRSTMGTCNFQMFVSSTTTVTGVHASRM